MHSDSYFFLQLLHLLAVIDHIFPLGIGGNTVIGAGDIAAQIDQALETLHLSIDGSLVPGKDGLVHAAHTADLTAILLTPGSNGSIPYTHFDGEHGVDTVLQPDGHQLVDPAIAVQRADVDAVLLQKVGDALIVGAHIALEGAGADQRTVLKQISSQKWP